MESLMFLKEKSLHALARRRCLAMSVRFFLVADRGSYMALWSGPWSRRTSGSEEAAAPLNSSSDGSLLPAAGVCLRPSAALRFPRLPSSCPDWNRVLPVARLICDTVTNPQLPWGWFPPQPPHPSRTLRLREHWPTGPCVQILSEWAFNTFINTDCRITSASLRKA